MFFHQLRNGDIRHGGAFPCVVELHFGHGVKPFSGRLPEPGRDGSRPRFRHGVVADPSGNSHRHGGTEGFADAHERHILREQRDRSFGPFRLPSPSPHNHTGRRIDAVDAFRDRTVDFRGKFLHRASGTAGTEGSDVPVRFAMRHVFRHGDRENAAQFRHFPEQLRHTVFQFFQYAGRTGAKGMTAVPGRGSAPLRAVREKRFRHIPGLVQVEQQFESVRTHAARNRPQIPKTDLMSGGIFGLSRPRQKRVQRPLQPDGIDARRRIRSKNLIRIWI
ncbi:MAG: hypothetical protein BWY31_04706 [Lentisphaerae bacterium ADurb.Bin242]|nr:MAG: hypothetical protein BWY31_04706 [Lentisphaerae bacterium ADurb.Bin242]